MGSLAGKGGLYPQPGLNEAVCGDQGAAFIYTSSEFVSKTSHGLY